MSRRERAERPFLPKPSIVPVAPSFLDLEQEDTVAYDSAVSLPALLAESRRSVVANEEAPEAPPPVLATTSSEIRPRSDSFHAPPHFPAQSRREPPAPVESNLHHVDEKAIHHSRLSSAPRLELVYSRAGDSVVPPQSLPPAVVRPRERPRRSLLGRVVLTMVTLGVLVIVAIDVSMAANLPWLDPRPAITKSFQAVKSKIPWDRLLRLTEQ
jgi:hypothetical protein